MISDLFLQDQSMVSISGILAGAETDPQATPTIVVVAHYDAGGAAPSLSVGGDSNASGVSLLLEISRLFSTSYSSSRYLSLNSRDCKIRIKVSS